MSDIIHDWRVRVLRIEIIVLHVFGSKSGPLTPDMITRITIAYFSRRSWQQHAKQQYQKDFHQIFFHSGITSYWISAASNTADSSQFFSLPKTTHAYDIIQKKPSPFKGDRYPEYSGLWEQPFRRSEQPFRSMSPVPCSTQWVHLSAERVRFKSKSFL